MKSLLLIVGVILSLAFWYQPSVGIEIKGGIIEDVVVADSGFSDSTLVTRLKDGWLAEGPNSFDVDQQGNIYILDQIGGRVLIFDRNGKWLSTFIATKDTYFLGKTNVFKDLAVDTSGNIFINRGLLIKLSPEGKLLCQNNSPDYSERKVMNPSGEYILVDQQGKMYTFMEQKYTFGIAIYYSNCKLEVVLGEHSDYLDIGIVQRDVGNDIYYREGKYLIREKPIEMNSAGKSKSVVDTVAILPDHLRLQEYKDDKTLEYGWVPLPVWFIGFDKDSCFYFLESRYLYNDRESSFCLRSRLLKYRLEKKELVESGEVEITFERGQDECSDKELFDFTKRFIVAGDGTIYFLHGTVDKIKISKITINEARIEPRFGATTAIDTVINIEGGNIEDLVIAQRGYSDSTFITFLDAEGTGAPKSFDIDNENNIYVLDDVAGRIQKFSKDGKWVSNFPVTIDGGTVGPDLTIDNWNNIYVNQPGEIVKYPFGSTLSIHVPLENDIKKKRFSLSDKIILTDKSGRVYNFRSDFDGGIAVFSREGAPIGTIDNPKASFWDGYHDVGIVQKEIGDEVYLRFEKYLIRTNIQDYLQNGKIDTLANLPDLLRLPQYKEGASSQQRSLEGNKWLLIGFDKDSCFYFSNSDCSYHDSSDTCFYTLLKYHLEKNELVPVGKTMINIETVKTIIMDLFSKQYIVRSDGTMYFLHGTLDKIKVSKITMEESKNGE
jgi:hypothetical protein